MPLEMLAETDPPHSLNLCKVWEEDECIISSQLSSNGFFFGGQGVFTEGMAANLLGAHLRDLS